MAEDTLTIAVEGVVSLNAFAQATAHFRSLVIALSKEVAGSTPIDWQIDDLQAGSAITTARGISEKPEETQRVIMAYGEVGIALQRL